MIFRASFILRAVLLLCLLITGGAMRSSLLAADFDVNGPTIELRRVQFCRKCERALVVTTIPSGARIQCPACDTIQYRLPGDYVKTLVFQVCPACGARMDVSSFKPETLIRCGTCHTPQRVQREAIFIETNPTATGQYPPDAAEVPPAVKMPELDPPGAMMPPRHAPEHTSRKNTAPRIPVKGLETGDIEPDLVAPGVFDETRSETLRQRLNLTGEEPPAADAPLESEPDAAPVPSDSEDEPESMLFPNADGLSPVLALVNGREIYRAEVERQTTEAMNQLRTRLGRVAYTPKGQTALARKRNDVRTQVLDALIRRELILDAATREGIRPAPRDVLDQARDMQAMLGSETNSQQMLDAARLELVMKEMMTRHAVAGYEIPPSEIRQYYEEHADRFRRPDRVRLNGLILYFDRAERSDPRPAQQIMAEAVDRLATGERFDDLVSRYSEGPFATLGGAFRMGGEALVPVATLAGPVQDLVRGRRGNRILGPVILASAVALLQVQEFRPAEKLPLTEVSGEIHQLLRRQAAREAFEQWVDSLREKADITTP